MLISKPLKLHLSRLLPGSGQQEIHVYITWSDTRAENLRRPSSLSFSEALFPLTPLVISLVDSPPLDRADNPSSKCI